METHDRFELVDQGLAKIMEMSEGYQRDKSFVELDSATHVLSFFVSAYVQGIINPLDGKKATATLAGCQYKRC